MKNTRSICALLLTVTVCASVLFTLAGMAWYGPGAIKDTGREAVTSILLYLSGVVSAYLVGRDTTNHD